MTEAVYFHTEKEFRQWFDENYQKLGVKEIILSQEVCPDYVVKMENGRILKMKGDRQIMLDNPCFMKYAGK